MRRHTRGIGIMATALMGLSLLTAAPAQAATSQAAGYPADGSVCAVGVQLPKRVIINTQPASWTFHLSNPNNCDLSGLNVEILGSDGNGFNTEATGVPDNLARTMIYRDSDPWLVLGKAHVSKLNGTYFYATPGSEAPNANGTYARIGRATSDIRLASKAKITHTNLTRGKLTVSVHATRLNYLVTNTHWIAYAKTTAKLQRQDRHGAWHTIASAKTNRHGNVTLTGANPRGKQHFRVVTGGKRTIWGATSTSVKR